MRLPGLFIIPLALLAGCTFNTSVNRVAGSPEVPRSEQAVVVAKAPRDAILLGTVTVRGNRNKVGSACEAEAVTEAKKIGATHVIVRQADPTGSRGIRCTADAYYVGRIV